MDVPILLAISPHTLREAATSKPVCTPLQQAPTPSRVALQWVHYLGRDVVARQVVATTAVTGQGTTAVITGVDAAATAAAVIAAARMIAPTPRSLPHLSLNAKTCCSYLALSGRNPSRMCGQRSSWTLTSSRNFTMSASRRLRVPCGTAGTRPANMLPAEVATPGS